MVPGNPYELVWAEYVSDSNRIFLVQMTRRNAFIGGMTELPRGTDLGQYTNVTGVGVWPYPRGSLRRIRLKRTQMIDAPGPGNASRAYVNFVMGSRAAFDILVDGTLLTVPFWDGNALQDENCLVIGHTGESIRYGGYIEPSEFGLG